MYLETILVLSRKNGSVRSIDIAEQMNYSKPSVSRAMSILKSGEYITVDRNGYISLTEKGSEIAEKIYERHTVISELLIRLGVDEETAVRDACKIEHDLSDTTCEIIKKHIAENI